MPQQPLIIGRAAFLVPPRIDQPEIMDLGEGTLADVRQTLDDLWRINRLLGAAFALNREIRPRIAGVEGQVVVLDLGAGGAHYAASLDKWAARNGYDVQVIALDFAKRTLDIAQDNITEHVTLLQADVTEFPLPPNSVDYVISSFFLHHFAPGVLIDVLGKSYAAARHGVIMADLMRGWLPYLAFKLISPIVARNHLTRTDGPISVRRSYRPHEFEQMAEAAGLSNVRVSVQFPWRMLLVADK